jgi:ElaB/YqjD/DUF883 family membrane-anchored ribosome-binding protein
MPNVNEAFDTKPNATPTVASAVDRLGTQASQVTHDLQEMGERAKDFTQEKLGQLGDKASEYYAQGRDKAQQIERGVEQFIREQPLKSILIAAGIGVCFGLILKR